MYSAWGNPRRSASWGIVASVCTSSVASRSIRTRVISLWTTIATFVVSLFPLFAFDPSNTQLQFVETAN